MLFALLAYVVGVIGYFVGRDSDASIVTNKPKTKKAQNPRVSDKMNSWWSFTIGALATLGAIVVLLVMGFLNTSDMVYGVFIPTFLSIVAGSISGLAALAIIDKINES
jgi:purine-cytosine permease-like protein